MLSCPLLEKVNIALTNVDTNIIVPLLSPRIVSLDLSACPRVDDEAVVALTAACSNLMFLNLDDCWRCTRVSVEAIGRSCSQMQELRLHGLADLPDDSMAALAAGCRDLRSLYFHSSSTLSSEGVCGIAACCIKIVDFTLLRCNGVTASAIVALVSSCPELRRVNIQADDAVAVALSQHCPRLTDVTLCRIIGLFDILQQGLYNHAFNGDSLAALLCNCQELRRLCVPEFRHLPSCSDGITSSVEELDCTFFLHRADKVVRSMLQYMPKLQRLRVSLRGAENATETAAVMLAIADLCPLL